MRVSSASPPPARALEPLSTIDGYRRLFFDADHWAPYVTWVARKHADMDEPTIRKGLAEGVPLGRLAEPRDVANAVLFLASEEAEFLTGVCLDVDGGKSIS